MTVMVPDLVLICENMLMAEGFIEAKVRDPSPIGFLTKRLIVDGF